MRSAMRRLSRFASRSVAQSTPARWYRSVHVHERERIADCQEQTMSRSYSRFDTEQSTPPRRREAVLLKSVSRKVEVVSNLRIAFSETRAAERQRKPLEFSIMFSSWSFHSQRSTLRPNVANRVCVTQREGGGRGAGDCEMGRPVDEPVRWTDERKVVKLGNADCFLREMPASVIW